MRRLWVGAAILSAIVSGCGGSLLEERARPVESSVVQEMLDALNSYTELMGSYRSSLVISISDGGRGELRCYLRYKKPDKLRVDVLGVLNELRAVIAISGDKLAVISVPQKEAILARVSNEAIERIFGVRLRVSDVRGAVLANPLYGRRLEGLEAWVDSKGRYLLRFKSGGGFEKVWVEEERGGRYLVVRWAVCNRWGREKQVMVFSDYRDVGGIPRPMYVKLSRPDERLEMRFRAADPDVNAGMADELFDIRIPPDVRVRELR